MSRLVETLGKYDSNLTVKQVLELIEQEQSELERKELEELEEIKSRFENKYVKFLEPNSVFGDQLQVYRLKDLVRSERTFDWDFVYYFNGTRISFSKNEIFKRDFNPSRTGNSFSVEDLNNMTVITEQEFNEYLEIHKDISTKLQKLVKK